MTSTRTPPLHTLSRLYPALAERFFLLFCLLHQRASYAWIEHGRLVVRLEDGRELATPLEWFPFPGQARPAQPERVVVEAGGYALYWPDLDEALGVPRLFGLPEKAE